MTRLDPHESDAMSEVCSRREHGACMLPGCSCACHPEDRRACHPEDRPQHSAHRKVTVEVSEHMAEILRGHYVIVPVAAELLPELRDGVACAGVQLTRLADGWQIVIHRDPDIPFKADSDAPA